MKLASIIIIASFLLSACVANPAKPTFPEAPPKLMDPPAELVTIKPFPSDIKLDDSTASDVVLSTVSKVVADNYATCNTIREQVIGLQSWITEQRKINK